MSNTPKVPEDLKALGEKMRRRVMGDAHVDRSMATIDEFSQDSSEFSQAFCWGYVWNRPDLDLRARSLVNLGMMVGLNRSAELKVHIRGALRNGVTRKEIKEVFIQAIAYAGVPAGSEGIRLAKEVFKEFDEQAAAEAASVKKYKVAFIGIGMMGKPMAACLKKAGHDVTAYDLNQAALKEYADTTGIKAARTLQEAVGDVDFVVTMLPDSKAVDAVLFGKDGAPGAVDSLKKGTMVIDMSSSDPMATRTMAKKLTAAGVKLVDAPVSGGRPKAVTGELSIMIGGSEEDVAAANPILSAMGTSLSYCGPVGAGHAVKALNNLCSSTALVVSCEALIIAERFGLDPAVVNAAIDKSSGFNSATRDKIPRNILNKKFGPGFAMTLMRKDVGIAVDLAKAVGYEPRLGGATYSLYNEALAKDGASPDNTEIYKFLDSAEGEKAA